jgi:putative FmdB family regulatory protein
MPIFEYKCSKCGAVTEFMEKAGGGRKHVCEQCGSFEMQKMFSSFAVGRSRKDLPSCSICPGGEPGVDCRADAPCPYGPC